VSKGVQTLGLRITGTAFFLFAKWHGNKLLNFNNSKSSPVCSGTKKKLGAGGGGGGKIRGTRLELGIAGRKNRVLCIVHYLLNKTGFCF
jgi:hypothetical protein